MQLLVSGLCERGATPDQIDEVVDWRKTIFLSVDGTLDADSFVRAAETQHGVSDSRRWFVEDDQLLRANGKTYALTSQWGKRTGEAAKKLMAKFSPADIELDVAE